MNFPPEIAVDIVRQDLEKNFSSFAKSAWPSIMPSERFVPGWHIDCIAEHLELVHERKIRNLLITIPVRHMKSILCSVLWPCWIWTKDPGAKFLSASYAGDLSTRFAVWSRRLIESPWYQKLWGHRFKMTSDQNVKSRYENDKGGARLALSVGGSCTGEGGDHLILDDANNLQEIYSKTIRESTTRWWNEVFYNRVNDPKTSCRVVIMQRGHMEDLAGHILEQGGFEHLCLPAEAEKKTIVTFPKSLREIVREAGDSLWPERFPKEILADMKIKMGSFAAASQLQQRPTPEGGGVYKTNWWKYYKAKPDKFDYVFASWDTGFKKGEHNDYSACCILGYCNRLIYVIDFYRGRVEFPELKRVAISLNHKHEAAYVLIEDKASGQSLIQELQRDLGINVIPVKVDSDKVSRAYAVTPCIESGRVLLPESADWLPDFMDEFESFPNGAHDDQVDAFNQGVLRILHDESNQCNIRIL